MGVEAHWENEDLQRTYEFVSFNENVQFSQGKQGEGHKHFNFDTSSRCQDTQEANPRMGHAWLLT